MIIFYNPTVNLQCRIILNVNGALLGKLAWNIPKMATLYGSSEKKIKKSLDWELYPDSKYPNRSQYWKTLEGTISINQKGLKWVVENGVKVNFWHDN